MRGWLRLGPRGAEPEMGILVHVIQKGELSGKIYKKVRDTAQDIGKSLGRLWFQLITLWTLDVRGTTPPNHRSYSYSSKVKGIKKKKKSKLLKSQALIK